AQTIQSQLAEAGIEVELEPLESGTYVDRWIATDFDMAVALNGASADPDATYGRYFTSTGNLNDVAAFSTDELDALFLEGRSESDPEARKEIYAEISGYLEDQAPWIWLFTGYNYTAMAPQVQGFEPLVSGSLLGLRDASIG
ncbi:ABC transporter substrate-binding protein, partial [Agrococcus casei]